MRAWRLFLAFSLLIAAPVLAQTTPAEDSGGGLFPAPTGVRLGYTSWNGIDQMHFGAHMKLGEVFPNFQFTPGFEAGFGDDVTIITFNGDLAYEFTELASYPWGFYGGGSLSLNYVDFDLGGLGHLAGDSDDWQLGLSGLAGVTMATDSGDEWMLEARFSLLDSPEFKLTLGYTFF